MSAPPHLQCTHLGLGPAPGTTPQYQPLSYPGGHAGINCQYQPGGLGNLPTYSQPYGAAPQPWGYGHYGYPPAGGYPPPAGYPPHAGYPPPAGYPPHAGYSPHAGGHLPHAGGDLPNAVPQTAVNKLEKDDTDARAEVRGKGKMTNAGNKTEEGVLTAATEKGHPNKQVNGAWLFEVTAIDTQSTHIFTTQTDVVWAEFFECAVVRFDTPGEPRLGYRISTKAHCWVELTCEADWKKATVLLSKRASVARTRVVAMEIRDMVSNGIWLGKKWLTFGLQWVNTCLKMQEQRKNKAHSKLGMIVHCWVEPGKYGEKGGHREISHDFLTLWAKYIECGWTTKHLPPNVKQLNHQPTKKPKMLAPPEVHIAVNFAPTPAGGAVPGSYIVSQSQQAPLTTAPGSSRPKEVRTLGGYTETCEKPPPTTRKILVRKATHALFVTLAKCTETGILINTKEVLTLLDADGPQPDGNYRDSHRELLEFRIHDALDIYRMDECFLATLGELGRGSAQRLHQFTHDKILIPLQLVSEVVKAEPTIKYVEPLMDVARIREWIAGVEQATVGVKEEESDGIEEVEVEHIEDDIKEIETDGGDTIVEVVERDMAFE
ncbi:hypothetical protein EI94DRAFT_1707096 [Lactarius quietus]|nr:hypothetical protein EI94DRAFT_1707096 [Lactarius quietus]